ncbi:MAG: hypothetical protein HHJ15_08610 [Rhodoferax sp.]|uniref:hypothetical protein n=1 Tax=Rhodoferax sp. TaxID=50421 RepID=UPI0017D4E032|nr:hypothetical protein [Rhodoferax sp.]NMM19992.1 hypothetical protein [Rhodoferax sp.]
MTPTKWESFSAVIQSSTHSVVDWGPLHGPIKSFVIKRDADLRLVLETTSDGTSASTATPPPAGTVRESTDRVTFTERYGGTATAFGVTQCLLNTSYKSTEAVAKKVETALVNTLIWVSTEAVESAYTIDWLENVPNSYHWPHLVDSNDTETKITKFTAGDFEITMNASTEGRSGGRSCVHLCIDGMQIFVGNFQKNSISDIEMPGYILYKGSPDASFREKLHNGLSFALGQYLVYLGHSGFTEQWELNCIEAVSPVTLGGAATKLVTMPPAPLDYNYGWWITPGVLQRIVASIFDQYERYHLRSVLWGYWHGIAAPDHIAAVHFAATVEGLQRAFFEIEGSASKSLLDKESWKGLQKQLFAELEKVEATAELKLIFRNKLGSLNTAPQSVLMERFLASLGIEMGPVEIRAWRNGRNRAAHGGIIEAHEFITVIRENKSLQVLVNRLILAVCEGADHYHDYYTFGHPISPLAKPSPDDLIV